MSCRVVQQSNGSDVVLLCQGELEGRDRSLDGKSCMGTMKSYGKINQIKYFEDR